MSNGNDLLMGSGKAPATLDFGKVPGASRGGTVVGAPTEYQAREYDPRNPGKGPLKFYDDGNPVKGLWIDVQTDERNAADDTGIRRLYVEKRRQREAIRDAVLAVGASGVEPGGLLWVTWTGEEAGQGGNPATTWAAHYTAPGGAALMGANAVAPQQQARPAYVPQAQTPGYVPQGPPPGYAPQAQAPGYTPQGPPPGYTPATPAASQALGRYVQAATVPPVAPAQTPAAAAPAVATAPPPAPGLPVNYVPASVYHAMANAGVDVAGFAPIPGS